MASDRTHSQQTLAHKRRGRKLGVKTVSDVVEQQRQAWLRRVTQEKGKNIQLCQLLRVPDSFVSHLTAGRRTFTDSIVERIEQVMHLPRGTIDAGLVVACETDAGSASLTVSHIAPACLSTKNHLTRRWLKPSKLTSPTNHGTNDFLNQTCYENPGNEKLLRATDAAQTKCFAERFGVLNFHLFPLNSPDFSVFQVSPGRMNQTRQVECSKHHFSDSKHLD